MVGRQRAKEAGLAGARWHSYPIPRKRLKELMKRVVVMSASPSSWSPGVRFA